MQLLRAHTTSKLVCRPVSAHRTRTCMQQAAALKQLQSKKFSRFVHVLAAEDAAAATAEQSADADSNGVQESSEEVLSPLDKARQALEEDDIDKSLLEECLAELEGELFDLRDQLAAAEGAGTKSAALESSLTTTKEQLLRLTADFDNFRKRTATEKDELSSRAKGDVVAGLLPLVDNFELARTQVKAETEGEQKINNSYQGLYKQMVDIMKGLGVDAVDTVGAAFDPELHEAIMREPNEEVPDGTVLMEFRKGFKMGDRLLRPAMVKVSFQEGTPAVSADTDSEPNSIDETT